MRKSLWSIIAISGGIIAVVFMVAFPVWEEAVSVIGDWADHASEITSSLVGRGIKETESTSIKIVQDPLPEEEVQDPLPEEEVRDPLPEEEVQKPLSEEEVQELLTKQQAVIYYIFISVIVVTIIITVLRGIYMYCENALNGGAGNKDQEALVEQYLPSMSVLLVSAAALFIVSGGQLFDLGNISRAWEALLIIILFFLVVLTAFEVVRIALEQCFNARSILKNLIRLLFLAILNFLSSILLGIISNMHIQSMISSLLFLVFAEDEDMLSAPINSVLKKMFMREISEIKGDAVKKEVQFDKFGARRIWGRKNEK